MQQKWLARCGKKGKRQTIFSKEFVISDSESKPTRMTWIYALDLFGTMVFAISGVLTAIDKRFDLVGSLVIGIVTAIGGGTLRDTLIGRFPVGWLQDPNYLYVIFLGFLLAYFFQRSILSLRRSMFLFDTIGIGLFTILGIQTAAGFELAPLPCLLMGVISAVFGGVIRDVLTNEIPLIFRKEIYATACLLGGLTYLLLEQFSNYLEINILFSMAVVMVIRYWSIRKGWGLHWPGQGQA